MKISTELINIIVKKINLRTSILPVIRLSIRSVLIIIKSVFKKEIKLELTININ